MPKQIGRITRVFRYPVKSMAGVGLESALLGWHGIEGDRRFAFRRVAERGGFPWLSASRLPSLILYHPIGAAEDDPLVPTHVRAPGGRDLSLLGEELRQEVAAAFGGELELMRLRQGIFDEAPLSVIATATMGGLARETGRDLDVRRFRPNVVVETDAGVPFAEDSWVGGILRFGSAPAAPAIAVTQRDERCAMINIDPETAHSDASVLKAAVRRNENYAGVYGTVIRTGEIREGETVFLED